MHEVSIAHPPTPPPPFPPPYPSHVYRLCNYWHGRICSWPCQVCFQFHHSPFMNRKKGKQGGGELCCCALCHPSPTTAPGLGPPTSSSAHFVCNHILSGAPKQ